MSDEESRQILRNIQGELETLRVYIAVRRSELDEALRNGGWGEIGGPVPSLEDEQGGS